MPDNATIALAVSLFSAIGMPLLKFLWDWWRQSRTDGVESRKQIVDENVTFAKEWRELYQSMEGKEQALEVKVAAMENTLRELVAQNIALKDERDAVTIVKKTLEQRVAELEKKFTNLQKAFEYLAETVEPSHPEAVQKARKIVKGDA